MIELWGMVSPNVQKVVLMLEELGLPFRFHPVDVFKGEQYAPAFGELTPNRKVPVILDPDGPGGRPLTLWESGAILVYLAEKSGRLLPADPAERYVALQWLMFQMAGVGPMFGQHSHFRIFAKDDVHAYSRARYATEVKRLYDVVETRLSEAPYLAGADYSIADIAAWPWMRTPAARGVDVAAIPHVMAWIETIAARPAAARLLGRVEEMQRYDLDAFAVDHPDALDRYLGRGRYSRP
jgi:GST-like protein